MSSDSNRAIPPSLGARGRIKDLARQGHQRRVPPKGLSPAMSKTQYGPDATWPRHQMPYWNEALDEARAAAWTLHYLDAPHRFGDVFCPGGDDGMRHSFRVDKTARGGESMSREARKLIRRCQHGSSTIGSKVRTRQEECRRLLDEAEQLISIADDGLTMAEARAAAWADLERLETQLETAAANVAEVLRTEQEAAWQAASDADDAPDPDTIAETLDDAATAVASAESAATPLNVRKPRLAKPLLDRAQDALARIAELRNRLKALP